jgi:protein TonB
MITKKLLLFTVLLNLLSFNTILAQEEIVDTPVERIGLQAVPIYPGGEGAFQQYIVSEIKDLTFRIPQTIYVHFVVEKDGSLSNVTFSGAKNEKVQKRVKKALKKCRKWTPGMQEDKPVRVSYTLPIIIKP